MILHVSSGHLAPPRLTLVSLSSALKFAWLHGHAVLRPAVRVHHKVIVVRAVGERAHVRFFVGRLWAKSGHVVLVGVLHDLQRKRFCSFTVSQPPGPYSRDSRRPGEPHALICCVCTGLSPSQPVWQRRPWWSREEDTVVPLPGPYPSPCERVTVKQQTHRSRYLREDLNNTRILR